MKKLLTILPFLFLSLSLNGCGGAETQKQKSAHKKKVKTPFDYQLKALKKAKAVDKKIQDAAKKQQQAIDEISSGTPKKDQDDHG